MSCKHTNKLQTADGAASAISCNTAGVYIDGDGVGICVGSESLKESLRFQYPPSQVKLTQLSTSLGDSSTDQRLS